MPMSHDVDSERGLVTVRVEGDPSHEELIACFAAYTGDPAFRPGMAILVDDRGRTRSASVAEVQRLAHQTKAEGQAVQGSRCALLVDRAAQYGMSRMYEILTEGGPMETRVFRDEDAALEWLLERPPAPWTPVARSP
jgi:hypothetical protein